VSDEHSHGHAGHSHGVSADADAGKLSIALGLMLGLMVLEITAGVIAHSLALLSDAGHTLTAAAAIGPTQSHRTTSEHVGECTPTPACSKQCGGVRAPHVSARVRPERERTIAAGACSLVARKQERLRGHGVPNGDPHSSQVLGALRSKRSTPDVGQRAIQPSWHATRCRLRGGDHRASRQVAIAQR
jgi:hypothetical protein